MEEEVNPTPEPEESSSEKKEEKPFVENTLNDTQEKLGYFHSRSDLQLGRRIFHFSMGTLVASVYFLFLEHKELVYILGISASIVYLVEQIRIQYPEIGEKLFFVNKMFLRAEEQLKESAAVPYAMALLLTIISFPKEVSLVAVYTLAVSDPLSAIVGIKFGKHKIIKNKSVEGSFAFFVGTLACALFVLQLYFPDRGPDAFFASFSIAIICTFLEMVPIRIDDNLTIPLFTAFTTWGCCKFFSLL